MEDYRKVITTPIRDWIEPPPVRKMKVVYRLQLFLFGLSCFALGYLIGSYLWEN